MRIGVAGVGRATAVALVGLIIVGCGAGSDKADEATPASNSSRSEQHSELAGVRFDVRRDPG